MSECVRLFKVVFPSRKEYDAYIKELERYLAERGHPRVVKRFMGKLELRKKQ